MHDLGTDGHRGREEAPGGSTIYPDMPVGHRFELDPPSSGHAGGETPEILPACAMVFGKIALSFCLASFDREASFSYSKSSGILMFSKRVIFAALSFSRSI